MDIIFVSARANRNWILGNWIRELNSRLNLETSIQWVSSSLSEREYPRLVEKLIMPKLPRSRTYFFTYPTLFYYYLETQPDDVRGRSIVLYTHETNLLGNDRTQVGILNNSLSVHFACSRDAERLLSSGLLPEKIRMAYGAIDDDLRSLPPTERFSTPTVLLCSRYSERKGLGILPEIVVALPQFNFVALGKEWENFLDSTKLLHNVNFSFHELNFSSRNKIMPKCHYFLSLSDLEGGPIPLMESMYFNNIPIATDTGFARDLIKNEYNGFLIKVKPDVRDVVQILTRAQRLMEEPRTSVLHFTWERLAEMTLQDHQLY